MSKYIDVDYHHINNLLVVPIPRKLHMYTTTITEKHRKQCDEIINRIYGLDVSKLLND